MSFTSPANSPLNQGLSLPRSSSFPRTALPSSSTASVRSPTRLPTVRSPVASPTGQTRLPTVRSPVSSPARTGGLSLPTVRSPARTGGLTLPSGRSAVRSPVRSPVVSPARTGGLSLPTVRSPVRSPVRTPARSPARTGGLTLPSGRSAVRSPIRSPVQSTVRSPVQSAVRSPVRSPVRAPSGGLRLPSVRSPVRSPLALPIVTPTTITTPLSVRTPAVSSAQVTFGDVASPVRTNRKVRTATPFPRVKSPQQEKSLYERLGGIFAIAAVVDHFSDNLILNPLVGQGSPNHHLDDWSTNHLDRLPGLKFMRTLWLASLAGGPYTFVPTRPGKCPFGLENAHAEFEIAPEEFDEVARELANSLDCFGVPEKEKNEVLAAFAGHKGEVTHAVTGGDITCPVQH